MEGISGALAAGQNAYGSLSQSVDSVGKAPPAMTTISTVIEASALGRKMAQDRCDAISHLAERASSIAVRAAGPAARSTPPKDPASATSTGEPVSSLDAALNAALAARDPLVRMDPALRELAAALDMLERAIG